MCVKELVGLVGRAGRVGRVGLALACLVCLHPEAPISNEALLSRTMSPMVVESITSDEKPEMPLPANAHYHRCTFVVFRGFLPTSEH